MAISGILESAVLLLKRLEMAAHDISILDVTSFHLCLSEENRQFSYF
jgi:hypothetical protein